MRKTAKQSVSNRPNGTASVFLAQRLRELREWSGLSQELAANAVGIGFKYYQQLEGARIRGVRLGTLENIAMGYGLTVNQLFDLKLTPTMVKEPKALPPPHRKRPNPSKKTII